LILMILSPLLRRRHSLLAINRYSRKGPINRGVGTDNEFHEHKGMVWSYVHGGEQKLCGSSFYDVVTVW
jgi:hypothetical protein